MVKTLTSSICKARFRFNKVKGIIDILSHNGWNRQVNITWLKLGSKTCMFMSGSKLGVVAPTFFSDNPHGLHASTRPAASFFDIKG